MQDLRRSREQRLADEIAIRAESIADLVKDGICEVRIFLDYDIICRGLVAYLAVVAALVFCTQCANPATKLCALRG